MGEGICGTVAERRQAMVVGDVQSSHLPKTECIRALGLNAYACFPLLAGDRLVGTLAFGSNQRRGFTSDELELLRTVASYVAVVQKQAWHRGHLERTVDQRTAALREVITELEHMSYSMVHNMRAPLRAIQGFSDLIRRREGERLRPESHELFSRMQASVAQMDRLITDALNYNKAVSNRLSLELVDVRGLLEELLAATPEFRPPQAQVLIEGEVPPVLANGVGLSQSLAELLRNALKFVRPGKLPIVKVWAERLPNPANMLRVWVEDNGIGIAAEAQSRIFNLFDRVHGPEYPGTGGGLALVRKLTEQMGGRVGVESEPEQGSRFWMELRAGL